MASQQDHAWADSLTPQIIEDIFNAFETGDQSKVKDLEDAGLIGPLEWIPEMVSEQGFLYDEFIEQAENDYVGEASLRWHERNGDC